MPHAEHKAVLCLWCFREQPDQPGMPGFCSQACRQQWYDWWHETPAYRARQEHARRHHLPE